MNEDFKKRVYDRLTFGADEEKKISLEESLCMLYAEEFSNGSKEIHFYQSDYFKRDEKFFIIEYDIDYNNGESYSGHCLTEMEELLPAYGFTDYDALKGYYVGKYLNDRNAWHKIVDEMRTKGLSPMADEEEGFDGF